MNAELPAGFTLHRGALATTSLDELQTAIAWEQRSFKMFGKEIQTPRLTAWYGSAPYTYSRQRHEPAAMPACVARVHDFLEHSVTPSIRADHFNSVLCNLYRDGRDSVAWHADDEPELGPEPLIASLSFGAPREFQLRAATDARWIASVVLNHGDLLIMSGRSQLDYRHRVPKARAGSVAGPRVNLTFRRILSDAERSGQAVRS